MFCLANYDYYLLNVFLRFMWQICAFIPQSLEDTEELAELATKLTSAFFLETYIHAKERVSSFYFS